MNKIMSIVAIAFFVVLVSTTVIFAQSLSENNVVSQKAIIRYENVKIDEGDCLSVIAEENNTSELSTKDFTRYIKKFNNLKSDTIYYGDSILIPIFDEN